jgi:hypothetical protein
MGRKDYCRAGYVIVSGSIQVTSESQENMTDRLREAIQEFLNGEGDGWNLTQYVIAMGLERITSDGTVESIAWYHAPDNQADWQTGGLLEEATALHQNADTDVDD